MSRSASSFAVLMFSVVVTFLLANSTSVRAGGGNCQEKLVGKSYNCTALTSQDEPGSGCLKFESGGLSADFDLLVQGQDYGCVCDASGSVKSPSFDSSSSSFECISVAFGFMINGKVKSKKLTAQGINEEGLQEILDCTESSTPCP
jgi:hypothetical protein